MNTLVKTSIKSKKFVVAAGVIMLGWAAASPAVHASDEGNARSLHVSYGDLNLESDLGARVLYARIRNAARDVCKPLDDADLSRRASFEGCVSHAITTSVAAVNNARVTAMYNQSVKLYGKS